MDLRRLGGLLESLLCRRQSPHNYRFPPGNEYSISGLLNLRPWPIVGKHALPRVDPPNHRLPIGNATILISRFGMWVLGRSPKTTPRHQQTIEIINSQKKCISSDLSIGRGRSPDKTVLHHTCPWRRRLCKEASSPCVCAVCRTLHCASISTRQACP